MRALVWDELKANGWRSGSLAAAILLAALSFILLTSATSTNALQIQGVIGTNFRAAYDILVRPEGTVTQLEEEQGLVSDNYLSGLFGGITLGQWRTIEDVPGVEAAAPIANLGYVFLRAPIAIDIRRMLNDQPVQLYKLQLSWIANGISTYPGGTVYVYFTRRDALVAREDGPAEVVPGHRQPVPVCSRTNSSFEKNRPVSTPFGESNRTELMCFSERSPDAAPANDPFLRQGMVGGVASAYFPMLLSAIDPVQEQRLVGLDDAVTTGRPLKEAERPSFAHLGTFKVVSLPILQSTRTFVDEPLSVRVSRVTVPSDVNLPGKLASSGGAKLLTTLPSTPVGAIEYPSQDAYKSASSYVDRHPGQFTIGTYRSVSSITYETAGSDRLSPTPTTNPPGVWRDPAFRPFFPAPPGSQDVQYRHLIVHAAPHTSLASGAINEPSFRVVGRFDPALLPGFSRVSRVPLESYYPPIVHAADAQSKRALGGNALLPTMNIGGYIGQPPLMLTTLQAAQTLTQNFTGSNAQAPISAIRIRVANVTGPDQESLDRIKAVALDIHEKTGLLVDITAGSSPHPLLVQLPGGSSGQPPLLVREGWTKKGVAVVILRALDKKSLALFVLVLMVTALFLMNASFATVRTRRTEFGTLLAMGWSRRELFRLVLSELVAIGAAAGALGAIFGWLVATAFSLQISVSQIILIVPVAIVLAMAAGAIPAWTASQGRPLDAVQLVFPQTRIGSRPIRSSWRLALADLRRLPSRALLGAAGLFIAVVALSVLLAINLAFRGTLTGTVLGRVVSVRTRGVDYVATLFVLILGAIGVAVVLLLNAWERRVERGVLEATGWSRGELLSLMALEALGLALLGSLSGAFAGAGLSAAIGTPLNSAASAAAITAAAATVVVLLFSLLGVVLTASRMPWSVLSEE
jgi:putative ABC transport system permease protein